MVLAIPEKDNRNLKDLKSFQGYCLNYPEQRFWQALRNWARENYNPDFQFIAAGNSMEELCDTFYLE